MKRIPTLAASCLFLFTASAQWTPLTSGLTSIRSMTHVGTDLYAVNYPNGVKKSTDGGSTWNPVNTGLPSVGSNVFCESVGYNGSYLFAGTQSGIYRSNDGGASWALANGSLVASNSVYANKWFVNSGVTMAIFAGSVANGGGIWRTSNNGDTWFIGHSGMGSNATVNAVTLVGTTLYASTNVGLYTSVDNGLNWTADAVVNYATYGLEQAGTNLVILSTFGYRYSTNGGATWNDATGDPAAPTKGELAEYDGALYANTGSSTGCVKSMDNGATWAAFNTGLGAIDQAALEEFHIAGTRMYVTALFDVYYITGLGTGLDAHGSDDILVRPTVFEGSFSITVPSGSAVRSLWIMDAQGRTVRTLPLTAGTTEVPCSDLAAGSYVLRGISATGNAIPLGTVIAR